EGANLAGRPPALFLEQRRCAVANRTKQLGAHVLRLIHHVPGTGIVMTLSHPCGAGPSAGERAGGGLVGFSHNRPPLAGIGRKSPGNIYQRERLPFPAGSPREWPAADAATPPTRAARQVFFVMEMDGNTFARLRACGFASHFIAWLAPRRVRAVALRSPAQIDRTTSGSPGHQYRDLRFHDDVAGAAAEDHLADAALRIGALQQQIGPGGPRPPQKGFALRFLGGT